MNDCTGQKTMKFSKATKSHPRSLSHTGDPETSYEAADKMVKSGKLNRQEQEVWDAILLHYYGHGLFTARILARASGIDYYTIQRRLSGLKHKGKIARTGEKRDGCAVWEIL